MITCRHVCLKVVVLQTAVSVYLARAFSRINVISLQVPAFVPLGKYLYKHHQMKRKIIHLRIQHSYSFIKGCSVIFHSNGLDETIRMNGDNVGFCEDINKLYFVYSLHPFLCKRITRTVYHKSEQCRLLLSKWGYDYTAGM